MSYTLADVDVAERRIMACCPGAEINRYNYDFSLSVRSADKSLAIIVFDDREGGTAIMPKDGDLDRVIRILNGGMDLPDLRLPAFKISDGSYFQLEAKR